MYATAALEGLRGRQGHAHPRLAAGGVRQGEALEPTILGEPLSFTADGDLAGAKFHIFKIENGEVRHSRLGRSARGGTAARRAPRARPR